MSGTAKRPSRADRSKPRPLAVESLEQRVVMATGVAVGAEIGGAPIIRLLDSSTGQVVAQATAFEKTVMGGARVAMGDVDGDGTPEIVCASGPGRVGEIRVFKQQVGSAVLKELTSYRTVAFGGSYNGGVEVACGDVDGNGREDIVAAMSRGGGKVNVFLSVNAADPIPNQPFRSFAPFSATYDGGASVAVADLGTFSQGKLVTSLIPDGKVEIVVGSGVGMRPVVKAYDVSAATARVVTTIEPMSDALQGGVSVSAGRINDDPIDDIVVSAGRGGGGLTEAYAGQLGTLTPAQALKFAAFSGLARPNAAVFTAPVDIDGDGKVDRFYATQGDPGGSMGIANVSLTGVRSGAFSSLAGPLRIAAPRTFFPTVTTASGLQQRDVFVGTGILPTAGKQVSAHYTGMLTDGRVFDTSRISGKPLQFTLGIGNVIKGWDEAIATMRVGTRRILTIPAAIAYGNNPPAGTIIPKGATLIFDVELVSAEK